MRSIQHFHSLAAIKHKKMGEWILGCSALFDHTAFIIHSEYILQKSNWRDQVGINWSKLEL